MRNVKLTIVALAMLMLGIILGQGMLVLANNPCPTPTKTHTPTMTVTRTPTFSVPHKICIEGIFTCPPLPKLTKTPGGING